MTNSSSHHPDLARLAADRLGDLLANVPVGQTVLIDATSDLRDILERLIPQILRGEHPEWERESIDGFFFSDATKRTTASIVLAGMCILISDQTATPFLAELNLAADGGLRPLRIRLGEAGHGPLGISGPICYSRAADELLAGLNARLDRIEWVYDIAVE